MHIIRGKIILGIRTSGLDMWAPSDVSSVMKNATKHFIFA